MHSPQISIVIPVYKRTTYFREALRSALAQTVPVEVLVVDDGTPGRPDGFQKIIAEEGNRAKYIYCETNLGQAGHWNRCLEIAQTPWVSMLHDDDILAPCAIEYLLEALQKQPDRGLYVGLIDEIDQHGLITFRQDIAEDHKIVMLTPEQCALHCLISGTSGTLIDRDAIKTLGGFNSKLRMTLDWDMWSRLSLASGLARINARTAQYRTHFDLLRGTTQQQITGVMYVRSNVQYRRNVARVRRRILGFEAPRDSWEHALAPTFALLRTDGWKLTPKGRRIVFAYNKRRLIGHGRAVSFAANCYIAWYCWCRLAYSYIRPIWLRIKSTLHWSWGPN